MKRRSISLNWDFLQLKEVHFVVTRNWLVYLIDKLLSLFYLKIHWSSEEFYIEFAGVDYVQTSYEVWEAKVLPYCDKSPCSKKMGKRGTRGNNYISLHNAKSLWIANFWIFYLMCIMNAGDWVVIWIPRGTCSFHPLQRYQQWNLVFAYHVEIMA